MAPKRTRVNDMIRMSPIRLVGADNEQIGVVETREAQRMAMEQGLDLVEVVPDARPPVCKIMDYGKYKYDISKKEQRTRAASKQQEMKEVRFGRSAKIDPHDIQIRIDQARRFLMAGHKVLFVQRFRGREIVHKELGLEHLDIAMKQLEDIAKVDSPPKMSGRAANMVLAPDKAKIESIRVKRENAEARERAAAKLAEANAEASAEADTAPVVEGAVEGSIETTTDKTVETQTE